MWWFQTINDDTIDKSNSPYLDSCWQQIFIGHRSYHCVPLSLTDWVIQSLLFQMTPVFKSENNSLLDAMFVALARVVDYMHGCFIHIFRVLSPFFVKWWNTLFNLLEHKLPERYLVTFFMKGKEGDEVQSIEPSAATWGRVINPSTSLSGLLIQERRLHSLRQAIEENVRSAR